MSKLLRLSRSISILCAAVAVSSLAGANPVTWTLSGVQFADGASATGTFIYDADTNALTDWHISTTDGVLAHYDYDSSDSLTAWVSSTHLAFDLKSNTRYLTIDLSAAMSDAGGVVGIHAPAGVSIKDGSFECNNCGTFREIRQGSLTAVHNVPEPASLGLVAGALGLLGLSARRRRPA
jgi:hypothetical protein